MADWLPSFFSPMVPLLYFSPCCTQRWRFGADGTLALTGAVPFFAVIPQSEDDPDNTLVPYLVETVVVPKLAGLLEFVYSALSELEVRPRGRVLPSTPAVC